MQRTLRLPAGLHLAVVMDGNGRWAERRGLARSAGHRAGAHALRRVVEAAPGLGVGTLTVYAFSADNWSRPPREVSALLTLLGATLRAETARLREAGVRLQLIGRRDRLPLRLRSAAARAEWETRHGRRLALRVAVDYSARAAICAAAARLGAALEAGTVPDRDTFEAALGAALHPDRAASPPVDLLVRAGGERRLSDFLLWEAAYAELRFDDTLWPDVDADWLGDAVADFHGRQRRFGGVAA